MASFVEELWNSIFTPGTTPTLLIATNATFACLQLVLLLLLVATSSIHFIILSALCGGLWFAINWFAVELKKEQAREEEEKAKADTIARQTADDSDETEVETVEGKAKPLVRPVTASKEVEVVEPAGELKLRAEASPGTKSGVSTEDEWEKVSENENEKDK
ncbi:ER protein Pkr1-domain-containing protein [Pseudomassariella vexata]|uniref:ER protein Pkr1-domain-containing protein n=1 Tax=Pseudomassariella vexata TaxID=1141098 RepID=A0A1Y2E4H0_9PEZI|nr:ER protein Pkr1-domain-containing protein [Pseudomassariella vexata]ORY66451.1 ER protein Pkr1-domain-containing protein [Pseudomassariella vexata]